MFQVKLKPLKFGEEIKNFHPPPSPFGIRLEGEKVLLEPMNPAKKARELFNSFSLDAEGINWAYLPYGPFENYEDFLSWIEAFSAGSDPTVFAIVRKTDNRAVGISTYLRINPANGSIEVGHLHFSPLLQKTTEATEAMFLMMQWAFENGYRRYEWKCNALNADSRKAAQRLGFSFEGVFRQMSVDKGRNRNTAWFAVIDKEWPELKIRFLRYLSEDGRDENGTPKTSLTSLTKPLLFKTDLFEFA